MKKVFMIFLLISCLLVMNVFTACGGSKISNTSSSTEKKSGDEPITLRINFSQNEAHLEAGDPTSVGMMAFVDYLEENGPGVFDVKLYWGNQLAAKIDETLPALKNGGFEMGGEAYGNVGGVTQAFMPCNFPFLLSTFDQAESFWNGQVGQRMRTDAEEDMGVKILYNQYIGFRHITNSRGQIKTPEDMQGLKIRTMNDPYQVAAMGALGASPTPMAWSELFTALQQKVVDAQENPIMNIYNAKMYEVQKYITKTGHNFTWAGMFVSEDWFESLPENAQNLLVEAGWEAEQTCLEELKKVEARMEKELVNDYDMEIYEPTPKELKKFQNKVMVVYDDIKEIIGDEYYELVMKEADI